MITSLMLKDFKNFAHAQLAVGPFTVIIGTNASGKSNIRDAFRFLHGVGRGYTLAEIIGGKYGPGGQAEWAPMRGAAKEIVRFGCNRFTIAVDLQISKRKYLYTITVKYGEDYRGGFCIVAEELKLGYTAIFTSHPGGMDPVERQDVSGHLLLRMAKTGTQRKYGERVTARIDQPALTQIRQFQNVVKDHKEQIRQVCEFLASMRFLDLVPDLMRKPAFPGQVVLGDNGENLPTVLQEICQNEKRKPVLVEWIRELTPMDVADFDFPRDDVTGLVQLVVREVSGERVSSYSISDGTLRFLAMLTSLLGEKPASLYFFEELDNGIHPSRVRLLLDLIERQTEKGSIQVVTTTHSPELLSMVNDNTFRHLSVVFRAGTRSDSQIRSVADLPNASMLREKQGLGSLHASGWIEDALAFTENSGQEWSQ